MSKKRKNPTCDKAIGSVSKEWKRMAKIALKIRERQCDPYWAEEEEKKFTGIFKRLLEDPIEEVKREAK